MWAQRYVEWQVSGDVKEQHKDVMKGASPKTKFTTQVDLLPTTQKKESAAKQNTGRRLKRMVPKTSSWMKGPPFAGSAFRKYGKRFGFESDLPPPELKSGDRQHHAMRALFRLHFYSLPLVAVSWGRQLME